MKNHAFKDLSLLASSASCLIQVGAQLFAILVIVRTAVAAPPRSLAMYEGAYGYDSSIFWESVPMVTLALLVVAIIANWKTTRRNLLLLSLALFVTGSVVAGVVVEPGFDAFLAVGYRDAVDPSLQSRAVTLYKYDWGLWLISLLAAMSQLFALARPAADGQQMP